MSDISQTWGSDLFLSASGDIALASGSTLGQQRVLRRLLTNPGDYIWQPNYGAGLSQFIGKPANALQISAAIRSQMFKEPTVARSPEPVIDVALSPDDSGNTVYVHIRYVDASSQQTQTISFSINA